MTEIKKIIVSALCLMFIAVLPSQASEVYPNKTVQVVAPYAAGGSADLLTRLIADKFKDYFGEPFVVVNKPGASGALASGFVATSKPDGYTLFGAAGPSFLLIHLMNPNFTYKLNDFVPIAAYAKYPQVIVVNKDLPVKNFSELLAYAKKNPNKLTYCSTGYAGGDHLAFELIRSTLDLPAEIQHIPYAGVAPAITALLSNQVQLGVLPFSALIQKQIEAGAIRGIAVLSPKRFPFSADIPSIAEEGYPQLTTSFYTCFWAPAKTPATIIKKLEDGIKKATEDKEVRAKIEGMLHEVEFLNAQELRKYGEEQVAKWDALIKKRNIRLQQ